MNIPASPYLTTAEAAKFLRFEYDDGSPNLNAFYIARHRHRIRGVRRGGRLLFRLADLDAFLEREGETLDRTLTSSRRRHPQLVHGNKVGTR